MIPKQTILHADRYVPLRKGLSTDHLAHPNESTPDTTTQNSAYLQMLSEEQRRCLSFSKKKTLSTCCSQRSVGLANELKAIKEKRINVNLVKKMEARHIIYAPGVADNYYSHPIDWSRQGKICLSLRNRAYTYQSDTFSAVQLGFSSYFTQEYISSIKCNTEGTLLYAGNTEGSFYVYDLVSEKMVREMNPHCARISCIENTFDWGILTGSKDCSILHHDLRMRNSVAMKLVAHKDEVCGLSVQNNKVASGGRSGEVLIWNLNSQNPFQTHKVHKGAVKALQWCPWKSNVLATGGGSDDRKIVLWNSQSQKVEEVLSGNSQVTDLLWRKSSRDLVTAHSGSLNQSYAMIWSSRIKEFTHILAGHSRRIVGLAVSPQDESCICTLSADETMRLWKTRDSAPQQAVERESLISPSFK